MKNKCRVPGCDSVWNTNKMCGMHYMRWKRHGDPHITLKNHPPIERFMRHIIISANTDCWIWQKARDKDGYGLFKANRKDYRAHRWIFDQINGKIPQGKQISHLCHNKPCVNPDHMEATTHTQNLRQNAIDGLITKCRKLTKEKATAIKNMPGLQREIATRFGVTQSLVGQIKRGEIWRE